MIRQSLYHAHLNLVAAQRTQSVCVRLASHGNNTLPTQASAGLVKCNALQGSIAPARATPADRVKRDGTKAALATRSLRASTALRVSTIEPIGQTASHVLLARHRLQDRTMHPTVPLCHRRRRHRRRLQRVFLLDYWSLSWLSSYRFGNATQFWFRHVAITRAPTTLPNRHRRDSQRA